MLKTIGPYKSFWQNQVIADTELPELVVITGSNGSGKTQLLEGIQSGTIQTSDIYKTGMPRLLTSVELQSLSTSYSYTPRHEEIETLRGYSYGYQGNPEGLGEYLASLGVLNSFQISQAELASGKSMGNWSDSDWQRYAPIEKAGGDLFQFSIGSIFSLYNQAFTLNDYTQWRVDRGDSTETTLSHSEFYDLHGEAPWVVLSRTMEIVGLPYYFETPVASIAVEYVEPRMIDISSKRAASMQDLSSGERTLLQIAMSMYSVEQRGDLIAKPSMILLDEPDAALHPSMVRTMLRLIENELIGRLGIPVIITTHSPTTVALAPETSLFVMKREGQPRMTKVTTDDALRALLVGVPALSVHSENRRLVIVESSNDERLYIALANIIKPMIDSERSLQFTAAGSFARAEGCTAVVDLVDRLLENGNVKIWGLVDRDYQDAEPHRKVFYDSSRHSIENVLLEPLSLALLLLRDRETRVVGQAAPIRYVSFKSQEFEAQKLINVVTSILFPEPGADEATVKYSGGMSLKVDKRWLETRGHNLSKLIIQTFPQLNKYHNNRLMDEIINGILAERPELILESTRELFTRLLDD